MVWRRTDAMSERVEFIGALLKVEESVTSLSVRFDVSRKTAYKWITRYKAEGAACASGLGSEEAEGASGAGSS